MGSFVTIMKFSCARHAPAIPRSRYPIRGTAPRRSSAAESISPAGSGLGYGACRSLSAGRTLPACGPSFDRLRTGPFDRLRTRSFSWGKGLRSGAAARCGAQSSVSRAPEQSSPAKHRACIRWQRYVPEAQCRFHSTANASPLRGSRRSGAISASGPSTQGCSRSGRGKINAGSSRMQSPNSTRSASSV